jgi:hypothetical protein
VKCPRLFLPELLAVRGDNSETTWIESQRVVPHAFAHQKRTKVRDPRRCLTHIRSRNVGSEATESQLNTIQVI